MMRKKDKIEEVENENAVDPIDQAIMLEHEAYQNKLDEARGDKLTVKNLTTVVELLLEKQGLSPKPTEEVATTILKESTQAIKSRKEILRILGDQSGPNKGVYERNDAEIIRHILEIMGIYEN